MLNDGPADLRHLAGHRTQGRRTGQAFRTLSLVLLLEAGVFSQQAGRRAQKEEAPQFRVALLGQAPLALLAARLLDADVQADVGDQLVRVGEPLARQARGQCRRRDGTDAVTGPMPGTLRSRAAAASSG